MSDADTLLYADSKDDKGIPGHTDVPILSHTSRRETVEIGVVREIPGCTADGRDPDYFPDIHEDSEELAVQILISLAREADVEAGNAEPSRVCQ